MTIWSYFPHHNTRFCFHDIPETEFFHSKWCVFLPSGNKPGMWGLFYTFFSFGMEIADSGGMQYVWQRFSLREEMVCILEHMVPAGHVLGQK